MAQMNPSTKHKQTHRHRDQTYGCQGGEAGSGMVLESGVSRCKLLHLEWISNEVLLYSTGNYMQYLVINHNGKEDETECVCMLGVALWVKDPAFSLRWLGLLL